MCIQKILLYSLEKQGEKQGGEHGWLRLSTHPRPLQSRDLENSQGEAGTLFTGIGFGSGRI